MKANKYVNELKKKIIIVLYVITTELIYYMATTKTHTCIVDRITIFYTKLNGVTKLFRTWITIIMIYNKLLC